MKMAIIVAVILFLVGSIMGVMPNARQRFQSKLRLKGRALGLQVSLARLDPPRARGEMEAETYASPVYRLVRHNVKSAEADQMTPWHIFRLSNIADIGLPEGWCWKQGERALDESALALLNEVIAALPQGVVSLEGHGSYVAAYWNERGTEQDLETIKTELERLVEAKV